MEYTRFIPTWDELKEAKRVKIFNKFTGGPSESVSTRLLQKIFFNAAKSGERVVFPVEWNKNTFVSKEQYEEWYAAYSKKANKCVYHSDTRTFSDARTLNSRAWNLILEGEEED